MKKFNFNKSKVALSLSIALTAAASQVAVAEENETNAEKDIEVIQIKGIRGSLIRSMDLKRSESGVVEAISAEELGKFPDSNLAEALQRLTGVTISRNNGEGSEITVRGFGPSFNLITLNGRQMPGTGNTRSYDLANLSSEGVSALEFYKTSRAEKPTGGLGATVNIETTKPLSKPGLQFSLSAKGIHDSSVDKGDDVTPEIATVFSISDDDQTLGFAFSGSYLKRDFQKQQANVQGWQLQKNSQLPELDPSMVTDARPADVQADPDGVVFFPRDMNYGIEDTEWERANAQVTFQYAPIDDLIITLDYTATRAVNGTNGLGWGMWNDYGGNINAYEVDADGTVLWADIAGNDGSFTASRVTTEVEADSVGINFDWQVTDTIHLEVDYHDSNNSIDNGKDKGLGSSGSLVLGSDQLVTKTYDYRTGEVPHAQIYWKEGGTTLPASMIDSHFSQFIHSPGESEIQQLQIHGTWENEDDSPLVNVKFGVARTEQEIGGSNAWSGLIGGFLFNPQYTEIFPDGMFELNSTDNFLEAFEGGGSDLSPNYYYTFDFDEVVARSQAFLNEDVLGDDYFSTNPYRDGGNYGEGSVTEETSSAYIQAQLEFEMLGMDMQLNAGARYEKTDVTSNVLQDVPVAVWWLGGSEWLTQYLAGETNFLEQQGEHDFVLPMFDLKIDVTDDFVTRLSWGKTITRAPLGDLAGARALSGSPKIGSRNGSDGNTNLQPYESTNLDLSFEYYYEEGSYAALGLFQKKVKNFISSKITPTTIDGFNDIYQGPRWNQAVADLQAAGEQATNDAIFAQMVANGAVVNADGFIEPTSDDPLIVWDINQPFNASDTKTVEGVEVSWQHLLGETGFGFGINATFVDGDVDYDVTPEDLFAPQTPLVGIGDSANFQAFYEDDLLSVKLVYAWRDSYLIGVGQGQGSSDAPPQFAKDFGQWDISINLDLNENLTVFFDGINLTNETEQSYGRFERQFLTAKEYGTRYVLGARYTF